MHYMINIDNIIKLQPVSSNVTLNITLSAFLALLTISCVRKQNV